MRSRPAVCQPPGRKLGSRGRSVPRVDRPADELYNLNLDPAESSNVAGANREMVAQLRARLKVMARDYREAEPATRVPQFDRVTIMGEEEARTFRGVHFVLRGGVYAVEANP